MKREGAWQHGGVVAVCVQHGGAKGGRKVGWGVPHGARTVNCGCRFEDFVVNVGVGVHSAVFRLKPTLRSINCLSFCAGLTKLSLLVFKTGFKPFFYIKNYLIGIIGANL